MTKEGSDVPAIYNPDGNLLQQHPAEASAPVAMAIAFLIAAAFDAGTEVQFAVAVVVAFVPTAVTWAVNLLHGQEGGTTYQRP
jgi:hypothetical protein